MSSTPLPSPGPAPTHFATDAFLASPWTRLAWSALFGLFVLWGLTWFLRHAFGQADEPVDYAGNPTTGTTGAYGKRTNASVDPEIQQTGTSNVAGTSLANDTTNAPVGAGTTTGTGYNENPTRLGGGGLFNVFVRMHRTSELLRDLLLMLLTVLVLNTFGKGLTRAVAILAWIFFAFAILFAIFESALNHRFVRLFYSLVFYGIALAIGGIAFFYGFYY